MSTENRDLKKSRVTPRSIFTNPIFISICGAVACLLVAILPKSILPLVLAILFTGLAPLSVSRGRWSPVGFLTAAISLSLPLWAAYSLIGWKIGLSDHLRWFPAVVAGICVAVNCSQRKRKLKIAPVTRVDYIALALTAFLAVPVLIVYYYNGPQHDVYTIRSWIHRDTFYLFSLAQMAIDRQTYPTENPFMAGIANHYPSFLHCGLGGLSSLTNALVAIVIWKVYPLLVLPGICFGFIAVVQAALRRDRKTVYLMGLGYLAFILIRIDHFILLQSTLVSFPLLAFSLYYLPKPPYWCRKQWLVFTLFSLFTIASHTVTSVPVLIMAVAIAYLALKNRNYVGVMYSVICIAVTGICFFLFNRGGGANSFEAPATLDIKFQLALKLIAPYLAPFAFITILASFRSRSAPAISAWILLCTSVGYWLYGLAAATMTNVFFVIFNAPRFALDGFYIVLSHVSGKDKRDTRTIIVFLLYVCVFPNSTVFQSIYLVTDKPSDIRLEQIQKLRSELTKQNTRQGLITDMEGFSTTVFSGIPTYTDAISYVGFALGTVEHSVADKREKERSHFFNSMKPEERLAFMRSNNLFAVVQSSASEDHGQLTPEVDFLPATEVEVTSGTLWNTYVLREPVKFAK